MRRGKVFPATSAKSLLNPLRRVVQSPRRTARALALRPGDRVLEVGSGPGFFSPHIADAIPQGGLIMLDLQIEMVTLARDRLVDGAKTAFVQADAVSLPFAEGSLDVVFLATMLGEVPDPDACISQVHRVLAPGGVLAVAETRRDSDFIPLTGLRQLVERHSFEFLGRRGPGWQYVARFRAV